MKRKPYVVGVVLGALALVFGAVMWAKPSAAEAPRLEQYLPADTVGFVQVSDLRAQALNIIESEAWRAFSRENQSASSLLMMGVNHAGVLDASYAVALLGTEADEKGNPRPAIVLVGEFGDETERREFQQMFLQLGRRVNAKGVEANSEEYGNAKVTVVREGGEGFTYAQGDRTFLLSHSTDAIKKVLDVRAGKAKSLETSETFLRARARTASREGMFGYLDGAALARVVESAPAAMSQGEGAAFRQLFEGLGLKSLESVAMSSAFADGRVVERVAVAAPNAEGVLRSVAQNPPTERALLALVPADALQAFDASVAGAPQVFDELLALAEQAAAAHDAKQSPARALREFTEKTGVDLRGEIVGALGAEVCAAQLASGEERGGVVILSLKDEAAFARALDKVAQQKKATVTSREYKGVTVRRMTGEEGHGPTYAFVNGYFIGSGDAFAVERVIDTAQGGPSLAASESFRAAGAAVEGAPQFVYFNSNRDYLARLGASLSNREHEFKTSGAASNLRPSFAFGVARADGFYVESRSPLGTFPRVLAAMTSHLADNKGGKTVVKKVEKEAGKKAGAAE